MPTSTARTTSSYSISGTARTASTRLARRRELRAGRGGEGGRAVRAGDRRDREDLLQRPRSGLAVRARRPVRGLRRLRAPALRACAVPAVDHGGRAPGAHLRRRRDVLAGAGLPRDARRPRFWCLPEADINIPSRPHVRPDPGPPDPRTAHEAMVTARRYGGHDALAAGIVDHAVDEESVRTTALEIARAQLSKAATPSARSRPACTHRP